MSESILYTPEDISQILKLSKYTIYEMIKRGDIEAHHIGRSLRISQSQLDSYLTSTKKAENTFDAVIVTENNDKLAVTAGVRFSVKTDLEDAVRISVKPEDIILSTGQFICSARNYFSGKVTEIQLLDENVAKVSLDIGVPLVAMITQRSLREMNITVGDSLYAIFKTLSVHVTRK